MAVLLVLFIPCVVCWVVYVICKPEPPTDKPMRLAVTPFDEPPPAGDTGPDWDADPITGPQKAFLEKLGESTIPPDKENASLRISELVTLKYYLSKTFREYHLAYDNYKDPLIQAMRERLFPVVDSHEADAQISIEWKIKTIQMVKDIVPDYVFVSLGVRGIKNLRPKLATMGLAPDTQRFACSQCGRRFDALMGRTDATCPFCHAEYELVEEDDGE